MAKRTVHRYVDGLAKFFAKFEPIIRRSIPISLAQTRKKLYRTKALFLVWKGFPRRGRMVGKL
jgi:hypothetical protein